MAIERTFSMIKPDATRRNLTGAITKMLEDAGLRVIASKRVWMSRREAEGFYAVHKERPFFGELVESMSSGPTIVQVLEGENAIAKNREVMGATNPANAAEGTIRKVHALSIGENSVHGSDAPETAAEGNRLLVLGHRNRRLNLDIASLVKRSIQRKKPGRRAPAFRLVRKLRGSTCLCEAQQRAAGGVDEIELARAVEMEACGLAERLEELSLLVHDGRRTASWSSRSRRFDLLAVHRCCEK